MKAFNNNLAPLGFGEIKQKKSHQVRGMNLICSFCCIPLSLMELSY